MKKERKFRFVGDPDKYFRGDEIDKTKSYPITHSFPGWDWTLIKAIENKPYDWEEVTEQEVDTRQFEFETQIMSRIPNKDQPASSMTKFEIAVFMAMQGLSMNPDYTREPSYCVAKKAISRAKETFKQLDELK